MIFSPDIDEVSEAQLGVLSETLYPHQQSGLNIVHFKAGRGAGKSYIAAFALGLSALQVNPRQPHLWAAPNGPDLDETFLPTWKELWPQDKVGWEHNQSKRIITMPNGTEIYYRGRLATNSNREPFRGPSWRFVVFDEARQDPNAKAWRTLLLGMRGKKKGPKTILTTSTPLLGWYENVIKGSNDPVFISTSYDNPVADPDVIERAKADYDENLIRQEIYGETVALAGAPWEIADLKHYWPNGNLHRHEHDHSMPYTLCADIGRQSAWLVIQHVSICDDFGYPTGKVVDVATAEYTPNAMSTDAIVSRIQGDYGKPGQVIIGADVGTNDVNTETSASMVMLRSAGWDMPIRPVTGIYAQKPMQYNAALRCLKDSTGFRRFCVSDKLVTHEKHGRGIVELLEQDQWPDARKPGFFNKDKPSLGTEALEDMRDCWMYGMITLHPIRAHKQSMAA